MSWSCCSFDLAACFYECLGPNSNLFANGEKVGFVRFKKCDEASEERRLVGTSPKLVCLDSGQGEEPLCAPFVGNRRRERGQSESIGVVWRLERHRLDSRING